MKQNIPSPKAAKALRSLAISSIISAPCYGLTLTAAQSGPLSMLNPMPAGTYYQDDYGNRCIEPKKIRADVFPIQNSSAGLIEQGVTFANACAITIPLRICYARSTRCREEYLPPLQTKRFVLGYDTKALNTNNLTFRNFSYEYYELVGIGGFPK